MHFADLIIVARSIIIIACAAQYIVYRACTLCVVHGLSPCHTLQTCRAALGCVSYTRESNETSVGIAT